MVRSRIAAAISLVLLVAAGFYTKVYSGPGAGWVNHSLGGAFYVIFWCLATVLVVPRLAAWPVAAFVVLATCTLEVLQLWHPPFLEWLRSFFVGRTILGSSFDWLDFPYYFLGGVVGYLWLRGLGAQSRRAA